MGFVGLVFAGDLFPAEFFLGLRGAEKVGDQFRATHVVEDLLAFLEAFAVVNVLRAEPTVETHVAVILKNGVVARFHDPCILGGVSELGVVSA